jgi:16S rRNA (cytidine1402-2'-O)-methyltransferase
LPALLYLVATPIGNLEDITLRALRVLREEATVIACEDTRQTQKLLDHFDIRTPLVSYYEHNEIPRSAELVERMLAGANVALVSDAGTPLVSDPGYRLVTAAVEAGITVVPIPGPCAAITALAASGLPTDDFRFAGFIPAKRGARQRFLEDIRLNKNSVVVYDSPHRIIETLEDISAVLGHRRIALARELTKLHEEILRGTAAEVLAVLQARPVIKGEITLVIAKAEEAAAEGDPIVEVARLQAAGIERMEAIKAVAKQFGLGKRELYRLVEIQSKQ